MPVSHRSAPAMLLPARWPPALWAFVLILLLSGCASQTVKTTAQTPLQYPAQTLPEELLLDVGVIPFDPGIENLSSKDVTTLPEIRKAESLFLANQIANTLQGSGAWGAVRMIPGLNTVTDVYMEGTILSSDGEELELRVRVSDTSGRQWFERTYREVASRYAYRQGGNRQGDPFQGLYNRIANDMLEQLSRRQPDELTELRTISELRFARDFVPDAYDTHISSNRRGHLSIARLPASNDPMMRRVAELRERDYLFIDTLQEHYDTFSHFMETPYAAWRAASYEEVIAARQLRRQSWMQTAGGIAAIIAGVAAQTSDNRAVRTAGVAGIGAGSILVGSGLGKRTEARMHVEALVELGASLEAELEPRVIEIEDRTITLTGNAEAQYEQWREILREIYLQERGNI